MHTEPGNLVTCCIHKNIYDVLKDGYKAITSQDKSNLTDSLYRNLRVTTLTLSEDECFSKYDLMSKYPVTSDERPENTNIQEYSIKHASGDVNINNQISRGLLPPVPDAHNKIFGLDDNELTLLEEALHNSTNKTKVALTRFQAMGSIFVFYCTHSQRCLIWHQTPYSESLDEETIKTILKIHSTSVVYDKKCSEMEFCLNIHSKERGGRLRWHQDKFNGKLVGLLYTVVLQTPNNEESQHQTIENGLVHENEDIQASGFVDLDNFIRHEAYGRAVIDERGIKSLKQLPELAGEHGYREVFNSEDRSICDEEKMAKKSIVYLLDSSFEKRGMGYFIDQRIKYPAGNQHFKVVHAASEIYKPKNNVQVEGDMPAGDVDTDSKLRFETYKDFAEHFRKTENTLRKVVVIRRTFFNEG